MNTTNSAITYPVMEHFYTLQGEGKNTGEATYFIRLGGCDVGCVWCDVKESWEADKHPKYTIEEILAWIPLHCPAVVITGGEPAMHNLEALTKAIKENKKKIYLETSGSHPITGQIDWVCLSPKKFKAALPESLPLAHELKIVIYHTSDLEWGEKYANLVNSSCCLYLQPEWSKKEKLLPIIVEYIKQNPKWKLSLQTHKYIEIP